MLQVMNQEIVDVDMDENHCNIMPTEGINGKNYKGKVIVFVYETCFYCYFEVFFLLLLGLL